MDTPKGKDTDHKDHNTLNNRKNNLRVCSHSSNMKNKKRQKNNISGHRGVSWYKNRNKWVSRISIRRNIIFLGYFNLKTDAINAYKEASVKYDEEFNYGE